MRINNNLTQTRLIHFLIWAAFLIISYRILLPFGDEPDFYHKAKAYLFDILDYAAMVDYGGMVQPPYTCSKLSMPGSFFDPIIKIEPFFCNATFADIALRSSIQILLTSMLIIFCFLVVTRTKKNMPLKFLNERKNKVEIILISIFFPTTIYYFGLYTVETFFIISSFLFFLYYHNLIISFFLICFLFYLDIGNGAVVFSFYVFYILSNFLIKKTNIFLYIFLSLFFLMIITFFHQKIYLSIGYVLQSPLFSWNDYFINMSSWLTRPDMLKMQLEKGLSNFLKPFITFSSMLFLTPNYLKSYILAIGTFVIFSYSFFRFFYYSEYKRKDYEIKYLYNLLISVFFIFIFVSILPSHSWFKYYVFLLPFMFGFVWQHIEFKNFFLLFIVFNLFTLINITYARLHFFLSYD